MIKRFLFLLLFVLSLYSYVQAAPADDAQKNTLPTIVIIPISGTVDAGMAAYLTRALKEARKYPDRVIVLEMDTFGGQVDAAFQIVDTMLNVRDAITIGYVKTKAISAGALIALSCQKLVMQNNTTIGDVAPLTYDNNGPKMLGEKFQSPIRAKFRTLAKRNNYPERLTEAMVTEGLTILEVHFKDTVLYLDSTELAELGPEVRKNILSTKTIDNSSELLTIDDVEANRFGFSQMSVGSVDEMLKRSGYENSPVVRISETWSEAFVRFIGTIAPVLIMIGLAALYWEMKTPGFGFPGIIGVTCLAIVFLSQFVVGLADYTELLLIGIGIILFLVEIFVIPGFGVIGVAGLLVMAVGLVLSFQGFVIPKPEFPWQMKMMTVNVLKVFLSILGSVILASVFFRYIFPKLGLVVSGPVLTADLRDAKENSDTVLKIAPGDKGTAETILRPAGKALINGELYDVVTEGDFINKESAITILAIHGNRIIVTKTQEST